MKFISLIISLFFTVSVFAQGFLPNAKVVKVHGEVLANKKPLKSGTEIVKGMDIRIAGDRDYAIIKFQNGHMLKLTGANVKFDELTEKSSIVSLNNGQLHALVNALNPGEKFVIKTLYANYSGNASKFGVTINQKRKRSYLYVIDGVAHITKGKLSADVKKEEDIWIASETRALNAEPASSAMIRINQKAIDGMDKL